MQLMRTAFTLPAWHLNAVRLMGGSRCSDEKDDEKSESVVEVAAVGGMVHETNEAHAAEAQLS